MPNVSERPFTILMPNSVNFQFKFEWSVYLIYFMYSFGFPQLYFYMLAQRKKFNTKIKAT